MTSRIKAALEEIEANRPGGDAKVRFDVYGGGIDESFIRGTRAGLFTVGLRLIRAGLEEETEEKKMSPNGATATTESLDDVVHEESDIRFDWIEISDQLEGDPPILVQSRAAFKKEDRKIGLWVTVIIVLAYTAWLILHHSRR